MVSNLGTWLAEQLITEESNIKTVIAIYPGRFQPMGKHHAKTFKWLQNKFGKANSFLVTSDKTNPEKSPFNFKEKQRIINKHGIRNVVQVKNPYQATELLSKFDPETTAAVFMVGTKDAQRLGGKFFRPWEGKADVGYRDGAYTIIAPHVSLDVPGFGEMSGTTIRQALASGNVELFKDIMGWYDENVFNMVMDKLAVDNPVLERFLTTISTYDFKSLLAETSNTAASGKKMVDDGPRYFYGNQSSYRTAANEMAKALGYSVINYIVPESQFPVHDTAFPKGPPPAVSFFPVGIPGGDDAGTDYLGKDLSSSKAYKEWSKYISNVAQRVGYKFLDFLGAEESINQEKPKELDGNMIAEMNWSDYWKEVLTEAKANTHLTHLEELILTQGLPGYKKAKSFILELVKNLKGYSDAKVNTSVKWDGAPAIFAGINPENGKFFVGTKSVFNKDPKINYTKDDVDMNHGHAPGLADKLKKALDYLPGLGIKNILQGDFMFDKGMVKTTNIDGVPHYAFRPNTITYAVEADSGLGKKIANSNFGIVFHTTYNDLSGAAQFGADVSGLKQVPGVWFDDAYFKDTTGTVTLSASEAKDVLSKVKAADSIKVDYDNIPSELLNTYINQEIRTGEFLADPAKSYENFKAWYQARVDKKVDSLKTDRGKEKAKATGEAQMQEFESRKSDIINIFKITKLLAEAKNVFVTKYNNAVYRTKHFVDDGKGGLKVSNPEGYVAVDRIGNGVKLVDRLEFSRANFSMDKGFAK